ncbi:MAG: MarP family serine protease [Jiangellaceae bacterium]|nr:MarP family serine protease [Jiangellaceae bacterium]
MILGLNLVDWLVVVLALVVAYTGWVHGFVVGLLSFVGFVGGAVGGLLLAPVLLGSLEPGLGVSVLAVLIVLASASIGQGILAWTGGWVRSKFSSRPARRFDALAGALLAVAGLLIGAWAVGLAISTSAIPHASAAVRESRILRAVDGVVPVSPERVRDAFEAAVAAGRFPEVVAPWVPEPIVEVEAPTATLSRDPEIRAAAGSVVKVVGRASCQRVIEGTGFVVGAERVVTNAHVVAGVSEPVVAVPDGEPLAARVALFDPLTDIAVLVVPGLDRPALAFREDARSGADAAVIGFPDNGPQRTEPVRVRAEHELQGRDIYDAEVVAREVISVRGEVRPGNSGGPLVADDGLVYGMVFAASLTDPTTGYALAPSEVTPAVQAAAAATESVPTGPCT